MATHDNYRPRVNHLNAKLYHFRNDVTRQNFFIKKIGTKSQILNLWLLEGRLRGYDRFLGDFIFRFE